MRSTIVIAGVLALAGCNQPAASGSGGTQTVAATSSGKANETWQAEDACALLNKATVGAALGTKIVAIELATVVRRTSATAGFSTCLYRLADGQQLAFLARQSPAPDNTPEAMRRARDESAALMGPIEDVAGVGKGAFWAPRLRQLVVFLGDDRYFNLTVPAKLGAKDPKTIALGLATRIE